jgi:hypothetical protein
LTQSHYLGVQRHDLIGLRLTHTLQLMHVDLHRVLLGLESLY